jgi:hypothetical protein
MERQLAAGLSVRGWLETSYYQLGADPGLSYMAAMGGWSILDYALNFSERPGDWLQLGYASYLSSWCLVNSGLPESNFGFWFPGKENDGAAGWDVFGRLRIVFELLAKPGDMHIHGALGNERLFFPNLLEDFLA